MPPSITYQWPTTSASDRDDNPPHEWDFCLAAAVTPTAGAPDVLGAVEFDPSGRLLATAGIARKIRLYAVDALLSGAAAAPPYICAPAKLSSLRWRPGAAGSIGAGDYDGVVTEYDVERGVPVFERDEHGGRRVWSVDYARWAPHLGASGSDDGTAQLWDPRCGSPAAAAVLRPGAAAAVCSAEFDPCREHWIGLGCADTNAYLYDVRMVGAPAAVLRGHRRTVTYVRFGGGGRMVTASTDGSVRMWGGGGEEARAFRGHANARSFVGLAVWWDGGLVACGSETDEVYVYDMRWSDPIWVEGMDDEGGSGARGFVSSVAWRRTEEDAGDECLLVAGGSTGVLKAWMGKRRRHVCI